MKRIVIVALFALFVAQACGNGGMHAVVPEMNPYIEYFAGIELLTADRTHGQKFCAQHYRELCVRTGVNAASAEAFIMRYRDKPVEWQNVQGALLDLLQSIK